jgi:hypothetical protein
MISSPYRKSIENLFTNGFIEIQMKNYNFAEKYLDEASILFMKESIFYSEGICMLIEVLRDNKTITQEERIDIEKFLEESRIAFTSINEQWKSMIGLYKLYKR